MVTLEAAVAVPVLVLVVCLALPVARVGALAVGAQAHAAALARALARQAVAPATEGSWQVAVSSAQVAGLPAVRVDLRGRIEPVPGLRLWQWTVTADATAVLERSS